MSRGTLAVAMPARQELLVSTEVQAPKPWLL
jgi:hypothetical protein